jgi:hypothetical protein
MRRTIIAGAFVAISLGLFGSTAGADTLVVTDRASDGHGIGDIRAVRLSQSGDYVVAQIRTARGADIDEAPAWSTDESQTSLRFNFDTTGDRGVDWFVVVEPRLGGSPLVSLVGIANSAAPRAPVPCVVLRQPEPRVIRVKVHQGCLNLPAHVRAFARYRVDAGGNGSVDSDDRAPQVGYTPFLSIFN